MTAPVRAFLAFEVPADIRAEIARSRQPLAAELPRARWVRPEGQHLTVRFLGEVAADVLDGLAGGLRRRLGGLAPVTISLGGAGFFPSPKRPRVAWVGGRAAAAGPVVDSVERAAAELGMPPERRSWTPHLTQARLDRPWPADAVRRFLEWGDALRLGDFTSRELVLFSSRLAPGGAVYTPLDRVSLE